VLAAANAARLNAALRVQLIPAAASTQSVATIKTQQVFIGSKCGVMTIFVS
jgi:hypothetical protein